MIKVINERRSGTKISLEFHLLGNIFFRNIEISSVLSRTSFSIKQY